MATVPSLTGGLPEYANTNYQIPSATYYGTDPRLSGQVYNGQQQLATDFKNNIPKYQDQLQNNYAQQAKQNLAKGLTQNKRDFNSRGLLKSGSRYGADARATQATNADINQGNQTINQNLNNTLDTLEGNYTNSAYSMAGLNPNLGAGLLQGQQNTNSQDAINNQSLQSIFSGGGLGLGYLASQLNGQK